MSDPALAGFDMLIDTRAPSEFAEDHLPGAINLPVLDDAQRAVAEAQHARKAKTIKHGARATVR